MQDPDQMMFSRQEITEMTTTGHCAYLETRTSFTTTSTYLKETVVEPTQICPYAWRQWQLGNCIVSFRM